MVDTIAFTDRTLKALKAAPKGERYEKADAVIRAGRGHPFRVRVGDKIDPSREGNYAGRITFVLLARYPGSPNPTRREIGVYPTTTLEKGRAKAREWLELIGRGIDPKALEEDAKAAEARRRESTVAAAVETWIKAVVVGADETRPKQRNGSKVARETRREIVGRWGRRPLQDIAKRDVIALVNDLAARGTPAMARNVLGHAKAFFSWCEAVDPDFTSPAATVRPRALLGKKPIRTRVLEDNEIFALWRASGRLGFPFGPMFRLLTVSGQRREEVAAARWREFHPELVRLLRRDGPVDWSKVPADVKIWTVGADRFKSDAPQMVPLSDTACAVLSTLPFFAKGDHLFSTTLGAKPVSGFSKAKSRLDRAMLRTLRALARKNGDDPTAVELQPFVNHDIRRTVRTRLSALKVRREVAEMVIGHGKEGLDRVYNQHEFADEMREALALWAGKLREIATPPPANVVRLREAVS
jgi:integrase